MKKTKRLGIWLDHTKAQIIKDNNGLVTSYAIESLSKEDEKQTIGKDESLKHNTEQNQLADFFKRITEVLNGYSEVLLFGPTNAKTELHNLLKENNHFNHIKIEVETTDNLTENQMHEFVREHFEKIG